MSKKKRVPQVVRFNSFDQFVQQSKQEGDDTFSSRGTGRFDWYGTHTFEDAIALADRGWPEGAAKAQSLRSEIDSVVNGIVASRLTTYTYDLTGEYVDVGLHLCGDPECFGVEDQSRSSLSQPIVKIVVNNAASGSVDADALIARGIAVVAAVDILESLGKRVELWLSKGVESTRTSDIAEFHVPLKAADQPLDIDRVAFALAHPSSLRRLSFSVQEQYGFNPCQSKPYPITTVDDAIVTREARRGVNFTKSELIEEVCDICTRAGIVIPQEEIDQLCA